jgi:subtilisin family serine protease
MFNSDNNKSEDEIEKIIVEFKDTPAILLPKAFQKSAIKSNRSTQLIEYLSGVSRKLKSSANTNLSPDIAVNKEFHKVFSGVQMEIPRKFIPYISSLDYVKKIHLDNEIRIFLDESVPLVKADKVWTNLSNKGKGIKISIIDTGIDYLHEALGSGFGTSYKVIGGYDFINMDDDPMDDNGHGTHVAGIVAANSSTLKGVAPEASLVACKVLDATGHGSMSSIIQAIEYSIDPNDDGDYSDAVDVINMSLGGAGTPEDPVSTAVNNASSIGVVVCVAAGNDGTMGFYTIGSPACAEKAITVGNSSKSKTLHSTSSKGPSAYIFFIKPDVLAPGTNIKSCLLSGGTILLSGTSMASPHLAGICALLKKEHPEWTPDEIKSAIKTTAEVLSYEPMEQGSGFVDAYKAISARTFVVPADLNFGLCDTTSTIWSPHRTLKIKNVYSIVQSYTVSISSSYPGIVFSVDKPTFSLPSGDSTTVDVQMSVDNAIVPFILSGSNSYGSYARITGTRDTLSIPWAFVKRRMLQLKFELPNAQFKLASNENMFNRYSAAWSNPYTAELNISSGNYDFTSIMDGGDTVFMSIRNNLNLTGGDVITVSKNQSKNEIHFEGKDEYGRRIEDLPRSTSTIILLDKQKKFGSTSFYSDYKSYHYLISDVPESHLIDCFQISFEVDSICRVISFEPISNLSSDIVLTNITGDLVKQKVKLLFDNHAITPTFGFMIDIDLKDNMGEPWYRTGGMWPDKGMTTLKNNYWEGYVVRNERISENPAFLFQLCAYNSYPPENPWGYSFVSGLVRVKNKQFFMGPTNEITPDIFVEEDHAHPVVIGDDIVFGRAEFDVSSYTFEQNVYFMGQLGDFRSVGGNTYYYRVYNNSDQIIDSGHTEISDEFKTNWDGTYLKTEHFQVGHSRFIDSSIAMLTSVIGNDWTDYAPPSLTSFQIRNSEGRPADSIDNSETAQLRFSVRDPNLDELSVKVEVKDYRGKTWTSYTPVKIAVHDNIGSLFALQLDSNKINNSRLLSIKVKYGDTYGNSGEWLLDPALRINRPNYYSPQLAAIGDRTILEDDTCAIHFTCTDQDNDPMYYILKAQNSHPAYEVNDSLLIIKPDSNWNGTDEMCLIASDGEFSDSTTFTLNVLPVNDRPNTFQLNAPNNGSSIVLTEKNKNDTLLFSWSRSTDVDGDLLRYDLYLAVNDTNFECINTPDNSFGHLYSHFLSILNDRHVNELILQWKVYVTDGIEIVEAGNSPREFTITNRPEGVEDMELPRSYSLHNAYPNPFNPATTIEYDIAKYSHVKLNIYDSRGRIVGVLVDKNENAGSYKVIFNASGLSSGIYFYKLTANDYSSTKKLMLIK